MNDIFFYGSIIVGVYIVMRFSGKIMSKLIGLALFLVVAFAAAYLLGFGPFKPNFTNIHKMEEKFCEGENKDQDICDCIVMPLKAKYMDKFTTEELTALNKDKIESIYVLQKAISSIKDESNECLERKGNEKGWNKFIQELLPANFGIDQLDELKEKFGSILEDKKDRKKALDEKFNQ